ncbi:polysaccharide pyruvyl transferase family protein [Campylobacter helveticus]|uniref:Polysaccharide pyruvyl transferase family protein n=1 Tax=Campylobacter helveticus TaxID=28898 RepID=A0AAX2UIH2_9BACT|nr:polysaccharide pyruvyl transferase family protein [Campylobacter helveticus]MCR2039144.1 polysaccharide pyruvyl transferase family protein [Campylobacter helveticus]MCR2053982.1 polysaccharide pyruvyl transferase family protein [Campylobacter helveticus]TNB57443.1 polysaccharide pyruvyl transferase family protein [Campylobacter helveticus]TNB60141.1 polysaccharide pyruvyl transferase family protein [Campylobacter helveticus]TNB62298.1 polysaccharide pyruvyl transferase family protein [Campy
MLMNLKHKKSVLFKKLHNALGLDKIQKNIELIERRQFLHLFTQSSQNAEEKDFKENHFVLFDYSHHTYLGYHNLGDFIQTIATKAAIEKKFAEPNFEYFSNESLMFKRGGGIVIMQGYFSLSNNFLPPPNVLCVFIGTHFNPQAMNFIQFFNAHFPYYFKNKDIGCRDIFTLEFCKKMGFNAYFSRCLTLTFDKREESAGQDKIFFVNIDERILPFIPENLRKNAEFINQKSIKLEEEPSFSQEHFFNKTQNLLRRYKNEAKLVVTTGLHIASPCTAMGIPVVLIALNDEQIDRFSALKDIIPIYTRTQLEQGGVDFAPKVPNIEDLKEAMLENVKLSVAKERGEEVDTQRLKELREFIANYKTSRFH